MKTTERKYQKTLRKQSFSFLQIRKDEKMHNIYDCVEAFEKLLDKEYHLILGRKSVSVKLQIGFDKKECFHLMGLQYLTDRPELFHDRGKIFDAIYEGRITSDQLESSDLYYKITDRINMFPMLESILDSNDTIFKYNQKINTYSVIKADYIMKNEITGKNVFLFLAKHSQEERFFCRSFFPEKNLDYGKNQSVWTLLYKKKITISTGKEEILYDRLNKT